MLNWHLQLGHTVFPKMTTEAHLAENMQIFDFELAPEDVQKVSALDRQARYYDTVPVERYQWIPITM